MKSYTAPELVPAWFVVANHVQHGFIREGARCYIAHDTAPGKVQVLVAPGGRCWSAFWTTPERLSHVRVAEEVVRVGSKRHHARMASKEQAEHEVERLVRQGAQKEEKAATPPG